MLSTYPIPGYDDLNKRESRSPEGASKKVIAFLVNWFWIRFFKIFFLIFLCKRFARLIFSKFSLFSYKTLILILGASYSGDEDFNELEFLIFEDAFTQFSIFLAKSVLVEIFKVDHNLLPGITIWRLSLYCRIITFVVAQFSWVVFEGDPLPETKSFNLNRCRKNFFFLNEPEISENSIICEKWYSRI